MRGLFAKYYGVGSSCVACCVQLINTRNTPEIFFGGLQKKSVEAILCESLIEPNQLSSIKFYL